MNWCNQKRWKWRWVNLKDIKILLCIIDWITPLVHSCKHPPKFMNREKASSLHHKRNRLQYHYTPDPSKSLSLINYAGQGDVTPTFVANEEYKPTRALLLRGKERKKWGGCGSWFLVMSLTYERSRQWTSNGGPWIFKSLSSLVVEREVQLQPRMVAFSSTPHDLLWYLCFVWLNCNSACFFQLNQNPDFRCFRFFLLWEIMLGSL